MSGDFHDEIIDPDDFDPEEKEELNQQIDGWLADVRPERYDLGDKAWQEAVIDKAAAELESMPHGETIRDAARRRVYRREQEAGRKANRFLREIRLAEGASAGMGRRRRGLEAAAHGPASYAAVH